MLHASDLMIIAILMYIILFIIGIKKKYSIQKQFLVFLFFVYLVGVVSVTLFPLPVQSDLIHARREHGSFIINNYVPFKTILEELVTISSGYITRGNLRALWGNLVLLMPLGVILPLLNSKFMSTTKITVLGLTCSIAIESVQLAVSAILGFNYRMTNVDDVILNTIGAAIGFILLKAMLQYIKKAFRLSLETYI